MNGTIQLTTERLILRRHILDDAEVLFEYFGKDPSMYEYSGWNPYETKEKALETVRHFIDSYDDNHFYGWAITCDDQLIGTIGAYDYDEKENTIEAGMSIRRDCWGNGYAAEALSCVLAYLTEGEKIKTVTAWCAADNTGSKRVLEKSGMVLINQEKDALCIGNQTFDRLDFVYKANDQTLLSSKK